MHGHDALSKAWLGRYGEHRTTLTPCAGRRYVNDSTARLRRLRNFRVAADGAYETTVPGTEILESPVLNKGSAFTLAERDAHRLSGLPAAVTTIDLQAQRSCIQFSHQSVDLAKYIFLSTLHDRNEVLYDRLLRDQLAEMLPIV
jgi:malate dehydrogenase (oxaloacetate-decarboxylating)